MTTSSTTAPTAEPTGAVGNRSRLALAAAMIVAGVAHFLIPDFYKKIIPRWIGHEGAVVAWSGVVELVCGVLLVLPRTRRLGAWLTLLTLVVVYPANIQMAIDAGAPHDAESAAAWVRLPLQVPMWIWAGRVLRRTRPAS